MMSSGSAVFSRSMTDSGSDAISFVGIDRSRVTFSSSSPKKSKLFVPGSIPMTRVMMVRWLPGRINFIP